jgi:hypothetical protein
MAAKSIPDSIAESQILSRLLLGETEEGVDVGVDVMRGICTALCCTVLCWPLRYVITLYNVILSHHSIKRYSLL